MIAGLSLGVVAAWQPPVEWVEMARKRIIIVEDERDLSEFVAMRLKREFYEVEVAHDGREALGRIRCNPLDPMLPPGVSRTGR